MKLGMKRAQKLQHKKPQMGSGLGQMSLEEVAKNYAIDLEKALDNLEKKGIKADKNSKMKPIAEELNTTPFDLFDILAQ